MYDNERWMPVAGYVGYYEVSDHGRVRSTERFVPHVKGAGTRKLRSKLLQQSMTTTGYWFVNLSVQGVVRSYRVHRLVAFAFLPPTRHTGQDVNHKDFDRCNNDWRNLEWMTRAQNVRYSAPRAQPMTNARMRHKLDPEKIAAIRQRYAAGGVSQRALAGEFGVHQSQISYITTGKQWRNLP